MKKLALGMLALVVISCGDNVRPPDEQCESGPCPCTVATEDADCGAHQYCNATGAEGTCACVAGYTDGGGGCVWTGTIKDPAVSMESEWTEVSGAMVLASSAGGVDPGEASFSPTALCQLAHVKQTVDMPTFAKAEPLVLELSYRNRPHMSLPPLPLMFDKVLMGVSFGGGWSPLPILGPPDFQSVRICLPAGGFAPSGTRGAGASVTFAFGPYHQPDLCPSSLVDDFAIDHVKIVTANPDECGTTHGQGPNFDAEGTGGWTFDFSPGGTAGFAGGMGVGGSRAARVALTMRCARASMETMLDIPQVANPALEVFVAATAGTRALISFGGMRGSVFGMPVLEASPTAATTRTLKLCLPPSLRGQVLPLSFILDEAGVCSQAIDHQLHVDNLRVVDDPACSASEGLSNASFEQPGPALGATSNQDPAMSLALVRSAPGQAHSGTRYLALETYRCSAAARYHLLPTVPAPSGGAGPALKFFANVGVNPDATTSVSERGRLTGQLLTKGGGYRPYTLCLNPVYAGRPQLVSFDHEGGASPCNDVNYGTQTALLDSLEVTTDPMCPAQ